MFISFSAYGFYGHLQNDQPYANVIYSDSENEIENDADWHDEPRLNLSQANEAMDVEVHLHFFTSISVLT
jgi:hypothetical protein